MDDMHSDTAYYHQMEPWTPGPCIHAVNHWTPVLHHPPSMKDDKMAKEICFPRRVCHCWFNAMLKEAPASLHISCLYCLQDSQAKNRNTLYLSLHLRVCFCVCVRAQHEDALAQAAFEEARRRTRDFEDRDRSHREDLEVRGWCCL